MNTYHYIQLLLATEKRLMENFIRIAEYYKTEPGIYYGCQEMASISNDHIREIRRESVKYKKDQDEPDRENLESMVMDPEHGNDLSMDLHFMWLLTMESALFNYLLLQSSSNESENDLEQMCNYFERETEKQSQWLMYRLHMVVRVDA